MQMSSPLLSRVPLRLLILLELLVAASLPSCLAAATTDSAPGFAVPASRQRLVHFAEDAPQPFDWWHADAPGAIAFSSGLLYLLSAASMVIEVQPDSGAELRRIRLGAQWSADALYLSQDSIWLLAADTQQTDSYAVLQLDTASGQLTNTVPLPYQPQLYGVDAAGTLLLTSVPDSGELVLLEAETGKQVAVFTGGSSALQVGAAALHPSGALLFVFDLNSTALLCLNSSDGEVWRAALPDGFYQVGGLSVDGEGEFLYLLWASMTDYTFAQYESRSGLLVNSTRLDLMDSPAPAALVSAGASPGDTWWSQLSTGNTLLTNHSGTRGFYAGKHPQLNLPSDIALYRGGEFVFVAENLPFRILQLDREGELVWTSPSVDEFSLCMADPGRGPPPSMPFFSVAVDDSLRIYMPICNGTILVWNAQHELIHTVNVSGAQPRKMWPTGNGSVWMSDDHDRSTLQLWDLSTGLPVASVNAQDEATWWAVRHTAEQRAAAAAAQA